MADIDPKHQNTFQKLQSVVVFLNKWFSNQNHSDVLNSLLIEHKFLIRRLEKVVCRVHVVINVIVLM